MNENSEYCHKCIYFENDNNTDVIYNLTQLT